ncbi:MAG: ribonuclease Y [Candidatus Euphemobacter frigidus]|nr:ribonuclease Y [Candidatus Euphemobacter frigidus]MDP8274839.1 ribonuclease Y [Candidatus Euphemobacter frigidus]
MNNTLEYIIPAVCGVIGIGIGIGFYAFWATQKLNSTTQRAKKVMEDADREVIAKRKELAIQVKEELYQTRARFEKETKEQRRELKNAEKRIRGREANIERKLNFLERRESKIQEKERHFKERERRFEQKEEQMRGLLDKQQIKLQQISGLSREEAKNILLASLREEAERSAGLLSRQIEAEARDKAEKEARKIITLAIQRYASDQVSEITVSTVSLPNDEMKGRIIGREGRNIRAFQAATGVDIIVDDTPEVVVLSGFDPVRREIARVSLKKLISDGRIHPPRIEEIVKKSGQEIERTIREAGERAAFDVGVHGLKPDLIKILGRLRFRTSYGQNVLSHSREVAFIMGIMASELHLDIQTAKKIGLLHDIGKAVDHEVEGPHAQIGANLAKKYGLPQVIVHAIAAHHGEVEPQSVFDVLGQAGDAISAARPGARSETMGGYIKRLEKLEELALSFHGVKKAYAIQAGREVRVMVEPDKVGDNETVHIARNISKRIEEEMDYPGQVKVTVLRETRAVEYAK